MNIIKLSATFKYINFKYKQLKIIEKSKKLP